MEDDVNIQKNQIFTVKITDMGIDGEGIGHLAVSYTHLTLPTIA